AVIYIIMLAISIPGNALIALVIFKEAPLRTPMNLLVCNIAIASLLIGIMRVPFKIFSLMHFNMDYPFSVAMCQFQQLLPTAGVMVISLTLTTICVDRYIAIVHPLKKYLKLSKCRTTFLIFGYWMLSLAYFAPYASFNELYEYQSRNYCIPIYPESPDDIVLTRNETTGKALSSIELSRLINWIFFGSLAFLIPALIMIVLYSKTIYTLWFSKAPCDRTQINIHHLQERLRKNRKAIKLLVACFLSFIIFNTPYYTIFLLMDLKQLTIDRAYSGILINILIFFNYSSIAYNAIIYGYFNLSIR
ncbi:uncharacterized protein TRIADDRAFT_14401, partial [Trichoplax adhaerens]